MSKTRRHFTASRRRRSCAGIRRQGASSDLADEFGVQPTQIHTWVNQVLDQAERAFDRPPRPSGGRKTPRTGRSPSSKPSSNKNEVIAELMEEHVQLKKELGEL